MTTLDEQQHSGELAAYPMVEESEATGTVAAVYADVTGALPLVPSVVKSLAVCPPYLALAWEQLRPVLPGTSFRTATDRLMLAAQHAAASPPPEPEIRAALAGFVSPLAQMLLACCGWREALADRLPGAPAPGRVPAVRGPVAPTRAVPTVAATGAPATLGQIRAALGTPLVNSVWRSLAGQGLLEPAWDALAGQVPHARRQAAAITEAAYQAAGELTWPVVANPAALAAAGIADAAPGMSAILDCYLLTLPRVLALLGGCSTSGD